MAGLSKRVSGCVVLRCARVSEQQGMLAQWGPSRQSQCYTKFGVPARRETRKQCGGDGSPGAATVSQTHERGQAASLRWLADLRDPPASGHHWLVWTLGEPPLPLGMQVAPSRGNRRDAEDLDPRAGVVIKGDIREPGQSQAELYDRPAPSPGVWAISTECIKG